MTDSSNKQKSVDAQVTLWFQALEHGDDVAAEKLWQHCFPRLLRYSRAKLPPNLRKAVDEEDVALSVFKSLCGVAKDGRLSSMQDRTELWKLLTCITSRKAQAHIKHETRQKRGGGKVRGESIFISDGERQGGLHEFGDTADSPAMLAEFADECQNMLDSLEDDMLQTIALLRIEGYTVDEIAARLGCAKRSVERRLQLIRKIWTDR